MTFEELLIAEHELRKRGYPVLYRKPRDGGLWSLGARRTPNCWPYTAMEPCTLGFHIPDDLVLLLYARDR